MTEASARAAIVAYCGLLWERNLVAGSSGNVSVRLEDGTLAVTPSGRSLRALQPEDIVRVSSEGRTLGGGRATSELPLHLAAYAARAGVGCVVHTHPASCVAWSKTGGLFPLDTVGAIESLGVIAFTRYARSGTAELAAICSAALRECDTIVMERHGLTSVAAELETAFLRTDLAEQTARIELAALLLRASKDRSMNDRPGFPADELRAAAGDHPEARARIDALHAAVGAERPDPAAIARHVEGLRGFSTLLGPLERWWLDPRTQAFISELSATGL